jgi:hypothetical protein
MSNFHILTPSWTSGAVVTSNSDDSTLVAASNLMSVQPSRKWRSNGLGTIRITMDAGEARAFDTLALLYHNGSATGTIRVTGHASTGALFSAPTFDSTPQSIVFTGDLSGYIANHIWLSFSATQTLRYIGIEIIDNSNPDGYVEAGVVVAGTEFEPSIGADPGASIGRDDDSVTRRLLNGEGIVRPKRGFDSGTWSFPKQNRADTNQWRYINRIFGSKIPIVIKWDEVGSSYIQDGIIYGYAKWKGGGIAKYANPALFDVEMGMEEL